jgi:hypothetical protein
LEEKQRQIQGSLHCAPDGKAVRRFGRDDVLFLGRELVWFAVEMTFLL